MHAALSEAVHQVHQQYGEELFVEGDCHTLAVALMESNNLQGTLQACMLVDSSSKEPESAQYLHMLYRCPQGFAWDINGDKADQRWEERMVEAGVCTTDQLRWEEIPYQGYQVWLQEHYGCIDVMLCNRLVRMIKSTLEQSAAHA